MKTLLVMFGLVLVGIATVSADEPTKKAAKPKNRYSVRAIHDPNGIGKFYMGREIAMVMGHQGISWLERPEREEEERLTLLVDSLQLEPGMTVADIGAGSGVISVLMAEKVGQSGQVLAVDIQKEMLQALEIKCKGLGVTNVQGVLGTTKSPNLDGGSVDLVIMVDVYHEFDFPYEMLKSISESLKPGGRVAFVEYRKEDPRIPIKEIHKMSEAQVKKEAGLPELNLKWVETLETLPRQHIILFEKISPDDESTQSLK
ncbi:class I SAM-dependent methyltransferase [Planctomicrobium sp. SH668]|uniref:class I SAM-dependent methyltransferase n=1 Tax=Planctomicrobium sp. SH668 TaxID=3448126 RepID=UPI003F5BACF8